jgi:membrane-associated phospholipid phosphatase
MKSNPALVTTMAAAMLLASVPARADDLTLQQIPQLGEGEHFTIDPVVDGMIIVGGATFAELLSLILSTGEIKPTQPGDPNVLLSIDRWAVTQQIDPNAGTRSTYALYGAYAYAILDPILSGVRDGRRALLVDAIMYAESIAITQAFTSATKIGVRRPRPIDYINCGEGSSGGGCTDNTDLQLSFFSGHASTAGSISATATYLAFMRSGPRTARPWITLGAGLLLTSFVSYERVRAGEHFPTDVIMGSLAGAGIGVLVPHFHHRPHTTERSYCAPPVWIGFQPSSTGTGSVTLSALF